LDEAEFFPEIMKRVVFRIDADDPCLFQITGGTWQYFLLIHENPFCFHFHGEQFN